MTTTFDLKQLSAQLRYQPDASADAQALFTKAADAIDELLVQAYDTAEGQAGLVWRDVDAGNSDPFSEKQLSVRLTADEVRGVFCSHGNHLPAFDDPLICGGCGIVLV